MTASSGDRTRLRDLTLSDHLARLGGARADIIDDVEADKARFAQMGVVILTTAAIAAVSAGFALAIVGLPLWAAIPIGIGWGFAILNLDRLLIVSMPYQESRTTAHTLLLAVPRVVLALIIGVVISTPMTLQIFSQEIDPMLTVLQSEKDEAYQDQLDADPRFAKIPQLEEDLAAAQAVVASEGLIDPMDDPAYVSAKQTYDAALAAYTAAEATWEAELNGSGGTGVAGAGPVAEEKKRARDVALAALRAAERDLDEAKAAAMTNLAGSNEINADNASAEVTRIQAELDDARTAKQALEDQHFAEQAASRGILARLEALDRLSRDSWIMGLAHGLLAALFVAIELLPVLMKTIMNLGSPTAYDRVAKVTDDSLIRSGQAFADARVKAAKAEADTRVKVAEHRADLQRIEESKLNVAVVKQQSAAVKAALNVWGEYAKKRTTAKVHEYEQDLNGGSGTGSKDAPGPERPPGFTPTSAPKPAPYSESVGLPDPDRV